VPERETPELPPFRIVGERVVYESRMLRVAVATVQGPEGPTFERDIVHHPGWVAVVPVDEAGQVTLVRQYRAAVGRWLLEVPAGLRDIDGEPPEETARRELAEEAGLACTGLELLTEVVNTPGCSDEGGLVFLATGLCEVPLDRQGAEEQHMDVLQVALAEVPDLIATGEITDAKTLVGLLLAAGTRP